MQWLKTIYAKAVIRGVNVARCISVERRVATVSRFLHVLKHSLAKSEKQRKKSSLAGSLVSRGITVLSVRAVWCVPSSFRCRVSQTITSGTGYMACSLVFEALILANNYYRYVVFGVFVF